MSGDSRWPVPGFRHFETLHCVTGSLRHVYAWAGHDLSEELLLGLGEGVGFAYFRFKNQIPFLGGRAQPKPSMEELACRRMGVGIEPRTSSSDVAAERSLKGELEAGHPVMIQLDMGYLPYFDFGGSDYHFGGHVVVVCGKDEDRGEYLIADRDAELHAVPTPALNAARGSKHRPFPPGRAWWRFEFAGFHE
ncbi:MAG TPA: BtrH N-terminal domain-containing protein, partial [Rectinemataceae bacterium]|nr:BtrH N-terminal domain-containing protein [Rectinemataceae bacterium]